MSRDNRIKLLTELERKLDSKVIAIITGDRGKFAISLASDILHLLHEFLRIPKENKNLSIFLYSRGGDTVAALSIVSLIREHYKEFQVLVPFRAHSAATMIALGANSIYLCKSGELSPVDVSLTTPFNPLFDKRLPVSPPNLIPVNVESVNGFINFVKDFLSIKEETELLKALELLCKDLNPLAIGAIHRAREQNKEIALNLMKTHINDEKLIESIAEKLTRGLFTHAFLVSRSESIKMKLPIKEYNEDIENLLMNLLEEYSDILELNVPYSGEVKLGSDTNKKLINLHRGIIEYLKPIEKDTIGLKSYTFQTEIELTRVQILDKKFNIKIPRVLEKNIRHGWYTNNEV